MLGSMEGTLSLWMSMMFYQGSTFAVCWQLLIVWALVPMNGRALVLAGGMCTGPCWWDVYWSQLVLRIIMCWLPGQCDVDQLCTLQHSFTGKCTEADVH